MAADLAPLPEPKFNKAQAELGRYFFFDERMSGDAALSCATCHDPKKGWSDGMPLSKGYPASEYFRNSPTVLNSAFKKRFMWDGRLDGSDMGTLVRDMITEAHTMNMDSRLMQERVKQIPEYVELWHKFRKDDPNGMRIYGVIGEFVKSVVSNNAPIDRFLKGDQSALNATQREGYELFKGKANCVSCHNGPLGSDGMLHRTGVPENPAITAEPLRHITMLRHYSNTLDEVVDFYSKGGGAGSEIKPLNLSDSEKRALVAFLESLSGEPVIVEKPKLPAYKARAFGKN
ncbi:MAG: c-type cytochrome [Betaproteobacteria bacterium]|nr:c-type cytochrome [Betaproteobacteria bacterium]